MRRTSFGKDAASLLSIVGGLLMDNGGGAAKVHPLFRPPNRHALPSLHSSLRPPVRRFTTYTSVRHP
jgi:hypothetical protein